MKHEAEDLQNSGHSEPKSQPNSNIDKIEKMKPSRSGMSRRTFLGVSAAAAGAVTAGYVLKRPQFSLVAPPATIYEDITEEWIATSCLNCPTRCATLVRVVNGHAVRIASNPLSMVSDGETCPRSHIGLQVLYDPNRVDGPLKRTNSSKGKGIDPEWRPISWGEALSDIGARLKSIRGGGQPHKLLLLTGLNSTSNEDLIHRFASAYGTPNIVTEDGLDNEAEKAGEWMADGHYTHSAYDLKHTNYILSFGAGIVESQKPLSRNLRMWGHIRRERPNRAKVVMIDPRYSVTAAKADQWIPINPGTDGALALAIANVIIDEGLYDASFVDNWTTGFDEYKALVLSDYGPDRVAGITGIDADVIRQVAREFAQTGPAIAWRGRGATCWPNGSYASYAIFCLNALVGSIDVPGGVLYQENPNYRAMPEVVEDSIARDGKAQAALDLRKTQSFPAASVATNQAADSILGNSPYAVEMAIGFNSNFNMSAPGTGRWNNAMASIPYYVHVSSALNETADYADIVLPACTLLEDWAYEQCPPGSGFTELKIKQPAVQALHDSKPMGDIVFDLARQVGGNVAESFSGMGDSAEGFVRFRTEDLIPWDEFRQKGVWVGPDYEYYKYDRVFATPSGKFEFRSGNMEALLRGAGTAVGDLDCLPHYRDVEFMGSEGEYPYVLATYHPLMDIENGNQNYPWAQEIYMVMHGQGWDNFVEMNRKTADELGIKDLAWVWVESRFGKLKARARVFEGIHPGVVAIACGQGHYSCGQWADGIGVNPNDIIGVDYDRTSGQSAFFNTRVRVYRA